MATDYFLDNIAALSQLELEERTWQYVRSDLFTEESGLYATKWWDYKPLHPLHATYMFADAYCRAFERAVHGRKDAQQAQYVKPLRFKNFLKCDQKVITGMWKARQFADRIGCTYDFYCSTAMKFAANGDWRYLPQPALMYSSRSVKGMPSMLETIMTGWEQRNKDQILVAKSDFYRAENYFGNVYQVAHQKMLMQKLEGYRGNKYMLGYGWVFQQSVLLPDLVKLRLGIEFYNEISNMGENY